MMRSTSPVFLNLTQIRMLVGALTTVRHRVIGVLLAAGVPVGVFLLDRSLQIEQAWRRHAGDSGLALDRMKVREWAR